MCYNWICKAEKTDFSVSVGTAPKPDSRCRRRNLSYTFHHRGKAVAESGIRLRIHLNPNRYRRLLLKYKWVSTKEKQGDEAMIELFRKNEPQEKMKVVHLPMDSIRPNPYQPRKYFDHISLGELTASIEEFGVLQPISVRRVEDGYEIIAGERRFRAAQNAGLSRIPAIVMNADAHKSALLALLENLQREDLCFFEIAEGYQKLIREQGMTQEDLAKKLGKSQSTVANKMRLLRLSPRVKKMIRDFSLTERHARALLNLLDEESQLAAVRIICQQRLNVQQSEELVRNMQKEQMQKKPARMRLPILKDVRIFTNTIRRALEMMQKSGIDADMKKKEFDWGTEYIIQVRKEQPLQMPCVGE